MPGLLIQYSSKAINVNSKNVDETSFVHDEVAPIKNKNTFWNTVMQALVSFFPPTSMSALRMNKIRKVIEQWPIMGTNL